MINKKSWLIFISVIAILLISCLFVVNKLLTQKFINPNKVLNEVKTYFMHVVGSYILEEPMTHQKDNTIYNVYRGGITTFNNDRFTYYDFYVDAKTGAVIDIIENEFEVTT
ncbi:PepSY domain-containing protein [Staphylococcus durrellii]|uniref:PepSY domain-containing protein n=1 Tax=Staphylococcus durrellii TaxID=2781773 RepID=UPI00189E3107|nr:PepSY domain-containing protein [Staphylococcus durrellii]MBF7016827.1 PepSY domain-containing protein [Staphylococcus durrellii]